MEISNLDSYFKKLEGEAKKKVAKRLALIFLPIFFMFIFFLASFSAPGDFPVGEKFRINENTTLTEVANSLEEDGYVRSAFRLKVWIKLMGGENRIKAGSYLFSEKYSIPTIAYKITMGDFGIDPVRVTIREGLSNKEIAEILEESLDGFNKDIFIKGAEDYEGYLFPDTYFFLPDATPREVFQKMRDTFDEETAELQAQVPEGYDFHEILTLASLIEREAFNSVDRRLISGVLWNRLDIGMALQVDAVFWYLLEKGSAQITMEDLDLDSPYNTYKYPGLPPGPIANPGIDSIRAALDPTPSDYLFYLADSEGVTHYALDFEEHKKNKIIHLP